MKEKRETFAVNAGPMADIAFLLLVFFLVTTTIASEEGIKQVLPRLEEGTPSTTSPNNVFEIRINENNQLLVENEPMTLRELERAYQLFLISPDEKTGIPTQEKISPSTCDVRIKSTYGKTKKSWIYKRELATRYGTFSVLSNACVLIETSRKADYQTYIQVQNALRKSVNELKDEYCKAHLLKSFAALNLYSNEEDRMANDLMDLIYPLRISDVIEDQP